MLHAARLTLAAVAALAVSGCGLVDAFVFPIGELLGLSSPANPGPGGTCGTSWDCGFPDNSELICDEYNDDVVGSCIVPNEASWDTCGAAASKLDTGSYSDRFIIADAFASTTDNQIVGGVTERCLTGSALLLVNDGDDPPQNLGGDGVRLELQSDSVQVGNDAFFAESFPDDEVEDLFFVNYNNCWVRTDIAGDDLPTEFAISIFDGNQRSNITCVSYEQF
jgi:hypothetical protein